MKDRMERLIVLPFAAGCISTSSVAVSVQQPRRYKPDANASPTTGRKEEEEEEESLSGESMKSSSFRFLALPKPYISTGFQRLSKTFKTFSQFFVFKEDEIEELEMEMEIGYPTDVKHVTHIGLDGSATTNPNPNPTDQLFSLRPLSVTQFEIAMAAQTQPHSPHINASSSYIT